MINPLLIILLIYALHKYHNHKFIIISSALVASSPILVYYSRYAIHEMLLLFFTCSLALSIYFYIKEQNIFYLYLAAISAALMLATKETAYITLVIFTFILVLMAYKYRRFTKVNISDFPGPFVAFLLIYIAFFSSFFTDFNGIRRSSSAILHYLQLGASSGLHVKPVYYYISLIAYYEIIPLIIAMLALFYKDKSPLFSFLKLWFILTLLAYSLIPYKTPWISMNILLPMLLLSSYALSEYLKKVRFQRATYVLIVLILAISIIFTIQTSFLYPNEDEHNKLAYAHTNEEVLILLSNLSLYNSEKPITIQLDKYNQWPLPWYFKKAGYKVESNKTLWNEIQSLSNCSSQLPISYEELVQITNTLNNSIVLTYEEDYPCLLILSYKMERYQLRDNIWLNIWSPIPDQTIKAQNAIAIS